jgi:hypothetical protein
MAVLRMEREIRRRAAWMGFGCLGKRRMAKGD